MFDKLRKMADSIPFRGELILWGFGILAAGWFFFAYPSASVYNYFDASINEQKAFKYTRHLLEDLNYEIDEGEEALRLYMENEVIDSLQRRLGWNKTLPKLQNSFSDALPLIYWKIAFGRAVYSDNGSEGNENESVNLIDAEVGLDDSNAPIVHLDHEMNWVGLSNSENIIPDDLVHQKLLFDIFEEKNQELVNHLIELEQDKSANLDAKDQNWLYFDFAADSLNNGNGRVINSAGNRVRVNNFGNQIALNRKDAIQIARFYLDHTVWQYHDLQADTLIFVPPNNSVPGKATVRFSGFHKQFQQPVNVSATVTAGGLLLELLPEYPLQDSEDGFPIWTIIITTVSLVLIVMFLVLFYTRIRARAIDTKAMLITSLLASLLLPAGLLLRILNLTGHTQDFYSSSSILAVILVLAVMASISLIAFFIIAGVGDSITRQSWPQKLEPFDLLRQGRIFNKPMGFIMLRSMAIGFILAGISLLALYLIPDAYIANSNNNVFYNYGTKWPALANIISNLFLVLIVGIPTFLIVGSQLYYKLKRYWVVVLVIALFSALYSFFPIDTGPEIQDMAIQFTIGLVAAILYVKREAMSVLIGFFIFAQLLQISHGWPEGSPDISLSYSTYLLLVIFLGYGLSAVIWGKAGYELPEYVPEYVKELAQEERIKQELEIARQVQQSFLPRVTPQIEKVDIAAICEPAYETGGDYYDVIKLDEHRIALTIGDVSGKGIQAAFYMTLTKGILHSLCREVPEPAALLSKVNQLFYQNAPRGTFISLIYGIIDTRNRTFKMARAGHNPILHWSPESNLRQLKPNGMGLGLNHGPLFEENIEEMELTMQSDDVFVLYTDGVVEALNQRHKQYGIKRLGEQIPRYSSHSAELMLDYFKSDIFKFMGSSPQHDDLTLMVIKMNDNVRKA